jgi:hypothetical protein
VDVAPGARGAYIGHATLAVPPPRAILTATNRRIAARHALLGTRVRMALASTGPVSRVHATLRGEKRALVGSGFRDSLDGRGSIALTLSRALKPGRYLLAVTANDDEGSIAARGVLRVSRRHSHARSAVRRNDRARGAHPSAAAVRC